MADKSIGGGHPATVQHLPQTNGDNTKDAATASVSGQTPIDQQYNPPLTKIKKGN